MIYREKKGKIDISGEEGKDGRGRGRARETKKKINFFFFFFLDLFAHPLWIYLYLLLLGACFISKTCTIWMPSVFPSKKFLTHLVRFGTIVFEFVFF